MSRETTLAAAEARHQQTAWKTHLLNCPRCATAARSREPAALCADGTGIRDALSQARKDLADSRALDRQPLPGQEPLF